MKKVFIIGLLLGGIIFGTSVYAVTNYLYNSNEVSYIPSDNTWSVDSVDKALDDLRDKAKNYMPIPTETKSITSNGNNIDVKNYSKVNVNIPNGAVYLGRFTNNTTMDVSKLGATSASQFLVVTDGAYAQTSESYCNSYYRCDHGYANLRNGSVSLSGNTLTIKIAFMNVSTDIVSGGSPVPVQVYYVCKIVNYADY